MLTQPTKASRRIKSEMQLPLQEDFGFLSLVVPLRERLLSMKRHQSSAALRADNCLRITENKKNMPFTNTISISVTPNSFGFDFATFPDSEKQK